ncbi:5712_t:CDS:2 [Funneliformis geosporum]|uniref:5712_t:CDS:1 n=1 Tax=Funneliformis geosporum TaxID=1117311 RepID=A0A9W4SHI2_9GLOM|nr:5712_t:CDS:2 [Funneliformis geosporum]
MSKTETKNSYADFDWLERAISEDYIKYYDFGEFTNLEEISSGSYVNVSCAKWKGSETIMALKHSFNLTIKEIVNEDCNLETIYNEYSLQHVLIQAEKLFMEIYDMDDSIDILVCKLIRLIIKTHDEGNNCNETEHLINHCIFLSNRTSNEIFEWLKEHQLNSKYQFFLGFLYFNLEKNDNEAFKLFLSSSESNYPIAQVYVASCYKAGFGTEINYNLAFKWMQKAVENKSIYGQINLSNYYENSIGTNENLDKAFNLYNEAANNGNLCGLFNMGRCYELGIFMKKNL